MQLCCPSCKALCLPQAPALPLVKLLLTLGLRLGFSPPPSSSSQQSSLRCQLEMLQAVLSLPEVGLAACCSCRLRLPARGDHTVQRIPG